MENLMEYATYLVVAIIAGMFLQWSGFLPWMVSKLPWKK